MKGQITASLGLFAKLAASSVIYSGNGYGTYYYDIQHPQSCGQDLSVANTGNVECSQFIALNLNEINSNNLVAMNHSLIASNLAQYCGRQVVVSVNGVASSTPFFIGDGCERCGTGSSTGPWNPSGAPGLDFSFSALSALNGQACNQGHIDISWQVLDTTLYNFDSNAPGQPEGPVSGGGNPGNGGGSNPGNGGGSCTWAGHCQGASCSSDDDCSDSLVCSSGKCSTDSGSGGSAPPATCSWEGHCLGASCSSENDCSDSLVCTNGKCSN
ncbi:hypothetical protein MKX08_009601 [Trichoderma sp. CBMAI-0020]|nr:hypothetical protein MKX08_009601 [Trichoderma sp. CBMAI-0020]